MEYLFYQIWGVTNIKFINEDIEKYKPKNIFIFAGEEHEFGNLLMNKNKELLEKKLFDNDIKLYVVFGSDNITHYKNPKFFPQVNTTYILWPMFWLYMTHRIINNMFVYNIYKDFDFYKTPTVYEKLFISLNDRTHQHRCKLMDELCNNKLIDSGYFSWHVINSDFNFTCWDQKQLILDNDYTNTRYGYKVPEEYFKTFVHIIPESTMKVPFLTEKTFMAILFNRPFIIFGATGIHETLVKHGFELYDDIFDYSFDTIDDSYVRIMKIIENLKKIKDSNLYELYDKIKYKIIKNRENAIEIINNKKYIPDYIKYIYNEFGTNVENFNFYEFFTIVNKI